MYLISIMNIQSIHGIVFKHFSSEVEIRIIDI